MMTYEEQAEWLREAKRYKTKRMLKWTTHIILSSIFVFLLIFNTFPIETYEQRIIAIAGGYIIALNIHSAFWIARQYKRRKFPEK